MSDKLLLLSAKHSEIPFVQAAKRLGYTVLTTGNKPSLPAHRHADQYVEHDYSDYDGLAEVARDLGVTAICQGCNDFTALAASAIGERLGFKGHDPYDVARVIHRKDDFKRYANNKGIRTPMSTVFESADDAASFGDRMEGRFIVKPVDLAGGAGVSVVETPDEYAQALDEVSKWSNSSQLIVEPYIDGPLRSLTTFLVDGSVAGYGSANDYSYLNKYLTNSGSFPADDIDSHIDGLIEQVETIADDLDLVDGLFHLQYIVDNDGMPWIIEAMRRSPGNYYLDALSRSTGVDWMEWILKAKAGEDVSGFPSVRPSEHYHAYHSVMAPRNGYLKEIKIDAGLDPYLVNYVEWLHQGDLIQDYMNDKISNLQLEFPDVDTMRRHMTRINDSTRIDTRMPD